MEKRIRIAVDGPSGAGKSTIAKILAQKLNIDYIDTGAMYRAMALKILLTDTDYYDENALNSLLTVTDVDNVHGKTYLDGTDVSALIRYPRISKLASDSSAMLAIRVKLADLQSAMGEKRSLIMDGRDIGSHVLPHAEYKFYLTASSEVRARRRLLELQEKGDTTSTLAEIKAAIESRDYNDSHREHFPLCKAADAIEIDSSDMTLQQVVETFLSYIK